jgi:hypothetical protein
VLAYLREPFHAVATFVTGERDEIKSTVFMETEYFVSDKETSSFERHREHFPILASLAEKIVGEIHSVDSVLYGDASDRGQSGKHVHQGNH